MLTCFKIVSLADCLYRERIKCHKIVSLPLLVVINLPVERGPHHKKIFFSFSIFDFLFLYFYSVG